MTRTSVRRERSSKKKHHYRPKTVNLRELRPKKVTVTPRVIYVQNPYFEQMERGDKKVEARPNYPCLRDLVPGTLVKFENRYSGRSFLGTITTRRVHRNFQTMLRQESIKDCLPDRDPDDLQRAVNIYHSFRNGTYKYIVRKHGVVSFRFERVDPMEPSEPVQRQRLPCTHDRSEYKRNSLCAIFEYRNPRFDYAERKRKERLSNLML